MLLFTSLSTFGKEYLINDFSSQFYCSVTFDAPKEGIYFNASTISICRVVDDVEVLHARSENLGLPADESQKLRVVIPYHTQHSIIYEDFNFDGEKDFAIQDFFSSKGPAFNIYLFTDNVFQFDSAFTEVIQNSQGNYTLDKESKTISTMSSGGCCWHSYAEYRVVDGLLYPMSSTVEESDMGFFITTSKEWVDGEVRETITRTVDLNLEGITELFSFNLLGKDKRAVLYNINDRTLNYVLIRGEDISEFFYPIQTRYLERDFVVSDSGNCVTFNNKGVQYEIYQTMESGTIMDVGIRVKMNGKEYNLKGDAETVYGEINMVDILKLDNVYEN